jgi:hypothetical protein
VVHKSSIINTSEIRGHLQQVLQLEPPLADVAGDPPSPRLRRTSAVGACRPADAGEVICGADGRLQYTPPYSMNGNWRSILSLSYSKRIGLKLVNLKDFATELADRLDGDPTGACVVGNVPSVPLGPQSP